MKTCKIRIQKEKDDEDVKNQIIKNFKEQVLLLQKHIFKLENDNNILKSKIDNLKIENFNLKNESLNVKNESLNVKNENDNESVNLNLKNKNKSKNLKIPSTLRNKVWLNCNGKIYESGCYCCSKQINITNFHCGHIISRKDNGPTNEDNLRPICSDCNSSMGSQNMETFKNVFFS
jgi:5-methylcytosine-specific restriction endonuclease McrA